MKNQYSVNENCQKWANRENTNLVTLNHNSLTASKKVKNQYVLALLMDEIEKLTLNNKSPNNISIRQ